MLIRSLSARRAWIEMMLSVRLLMFFWVALRKESVDRNVFLTLTVRNVPMSLSARRAWIEMIECRELLHPSCSRSPQGERG